MARATVCFCILFAVMAMAGGQNIMSEVPKGNSMIELKAQITQLAGELKEVRSENNKQRQELASIQKGGNGGKRCDDSTGGVVYVRWGRHSCPNNATLVYSGVAGSSNYDHSGGGVNYLCLPRDPEWGEPTVDSASGSYVSGVKYDFPDGNSPFLKTNLDAGKVFDNVPCSVCYVSERRAKLMIPARKTCPGGWKREYGGYLMTSHRFKHRTTFACMDEAPETIAPSGGSGYGAYTYTVQADCGSSLPCHPYKAGWAITCVVCTK